MRTLIHFAHTSLDGYIEGPNGEFDWPAMGPELSAYSRGLHDRIDTFLYGRKVWDMMAGFWPQAESISDDPHDLAFAPLWRSTPKIVVSRTLEKAGWDTRVIHDVAELAEVKRQPGKDLLLTGGAELAGALTDHGLIDEYLVAVHPVVLGGGIPLFRSRDRFGLRLVESRTFDGQTVLLRYERPGTRV